MKQGASTRAERWEKALTPPPMDIKVDADELAALRAELARLKDRERECNTRLVRAPHKGRQLEDLKKAEWYLRRLIENLEREALEQAVPGGT